MGGKLFNTQRLESDKYFELCGRVEKLLNGIFGRVYLVRAYKSKRDHGDGDFLCAEPSDTYTPIPKQLENLFGLKKEDIKPNSNIISFVLENFQFDAIITKPRYFESSSFYYSDSPSGNAVGKLAHFLAVSFGFDGLYYTLRDDANTYKLGKIPISTDMAKICEFFGLDYQKKMVGFQEEKDIFDWIVGSKYFDARLFSWEAMNHRSRIRDSKRPDYHRLLEYVNKSHKEKTFDRLDRKSNLILVDKYFPEANLLGQISDLQEKHRRNCELSQKFNGNLVMSWIPNLAGKELGHVLGGYKDGKDWMKFLEEKSAEELKIDFLQYYDNNKV